MKKRNHIDYEHPKTFDSPFMSSEYGSGIVTLRKGSHQMTIDMNDKKP